MKKEEGDTITKDYIREKTFEEFKLHLFREEEEEEEIVLKSQELRRLDEKEEKKKKELEERFSIVPKGSLNK